MTLVDVLLRAADEAPDQVIVHVDGDGSEHAVTYRDLRDDAVRVAGGLRSVAPGTPVILRLDRSADFQAAFWAAGFLVAFAPQLVVWRLLYGAFVTIPQGGGFVAGHPAWAGVLFSPHHGLFAWSPLLYALLDALGPWPRGECSMCYICV